MVKGRLRNICPKNNTNPYPLYLAVYWLTYITQRLELAPLTQNSITFDGPTTIKALAPNQRMHANHGIVFMMLDTYFLCQASGVPFLKHKEVRGKGVERNDSSIDSHVLGCRTAP